MDDSNYLSLPAEFNYCEALMLWEQGWCYKALSLKYGYCKDTIKKYVKKETEDYQLSYKKHKQYHKTCPVCLKGKEKNVNQLSLL